MKNWKQRFLLGTVIMSILLLPFYTIWAQEITPESKTESIEAQKDEEKKEVQLETTVVTATKTETKIQEVPVTIHVVGKDDIDRMPNRNALDAIRTIPGMYVSNTGNRPTIYGRSAQSLFLVDGQPGQSSGITYFFYNDLFSNPDVVERIEVIAGPGSVLYGANAQGAVVNVITKPGQKEPFFDVYQEFGEARHTKSSFTGGAGADTFTFYLNGSYTSQGDWFDSDHEHVDYTDYRKKNFFGRMDWYPTDQTAVDFTLSHSEGQEWFHYRDPVPWTMYSDVEPRNTMFATSVSHDFSANSRISFNMSYADRKHEDTTWMYIHPEMGAPNMITTMESKTVFVEPRYSYSSQLCSWLNQTLTVGGTYDHTEYSGDWYFMGMFLSQDKIDNVRAVYLQEELSITRYARLLLGGRYDKHPNFDGEFSPRVGLSILPADRLTLYTSYSESFRAPSFTDRYGLMWANPDLDPEKGKTIEFGVKANLGRWANLNLVYYDSEYDDMIQGDMAEMLIKNIGEAEIKGWEGILTLTPNPHIELSGSFNVRDVEDKAYHTQILGMPENIYTATLYLKDIYGFDLSSVYQYVDKRYGDQLNTFYAPSYEKVDLKISYTVGLPKDCSWGRQVKIYAVVENLFNEDNIQGWYPGYHLPGRMIWSGIKYSW